MIGQELRLFCRLDGLTIAAREHQRQTAMTELGLLQVESVPVFEEAAQTAAQTLVVPICVLGIVEADREWFKSAIGLSRLGLMNELATSRQLPRQDAFSTYVVDSQQIVLIEDTLNHPVFANSILAYQYGVRAYMGAPLMTSTGICVGALSVLDTTPRSFTQQDIEFLQLTARWCMSEYERSRMAVGQFFPLSAATATNAAPPTPEATPSTAIAHQVRVDLLGHLAQELRTPLTSVMGMASVLNREIYGPLTSKQKEYLNIIHNSGQYLLSLMNEIVELSEFKDSDHCLNLSSVDVEMLCQQSINTLAQAAQRREQQIRLTVEPGRRIWMIDKEKVRQMVYHLLFSVIQASTAGSIIRLHISRGENTLNLSIWVSHPWLGEGLPYVEIYSEPALVGVRADRQLDEFEFEGFTRLATDTEFEPEAINPVRAQTAPDQDSPRKNLGLTLSRYLAELHQGEISVQGTEESGYRYVIRLPYMNDPATA